MKIDLKVVLISCLIAGVSIFFIWWIATFFGYLNIPHEIRNELIAEKFNGEVISISESSPCFKKIGVKELKEKIDLNLCKCGDQKEFWSFLEIGDTIKKDAGQLNLFVVKKTTRESREFAYPYCIQ